MLPYGASERSPAADAILARPAPLRSLSARRRARSMIIGVLLCRFPDIMRLLIRPGRNQFGYVSGKEETHRADRQGRPGILCSQPAGSGRHRSRSRPAGTTGCGAALRSAQRARSGARRNGGRTRHPYGGRPAHRGRAGLGPRPSAAWRPAVRRRCARGRSGRGAGQAPCPARRSGRDRAAARGRQGRGDVRRDLPAGGPRPGRRRPTGPSSRRRPTTPRARCSSTARRARTGLAGGRLFFFSSSVPRATSSGRSSSP